MPAPGDPKTHKLDVTIHDLLPLDAYAADNGRCAPTPHPPEFPPTLSLSGPSRTFEERALDESFPIPTTAQLLSDGSCQATMQVTVPYKPRYRAGVAIEGRGIVRDTDPTNDMFATKGDSQAITVLR